MKKKMNYTKEFKVKACELVLKDEVKVKTVASLRVNGQAANQSKTQN